MGGCTRCSLSMRRVCASSERVARRRAAEAVAREARGALARAEGDASHARGALAAAEAELRDANAARALAVTAAYRLSLGRGRRAIGASALRASAQVAAECRRLEVDGFTQTKSTIDTKHLVLQV